MGSSLSQQLCCVPCQRCREQQAANAEPSETKPILQSPGDTRTFLDTQPPTPALRVPKQGSKELLQGCQPSADALEENGERCSAAGPAARAEGWEAAWNPIDFSVSPADGEVEGAVEDLTQQEKVAKTEEMEAVPDAPVGGTTLGAELVAEEEQPRAPGQPDSEGAPSAGIILQEGNVPGLTGLLAEAEPGQGCGTEPPADTGEVLMGRDLSVCAVQVPGQPESSLCAQPVKGTGGAKAAETSPQSALRAELSYLVDAMSLLTLQSPSEVIARGMSQFYSTSAVSWEPLCPQWASLETPKLLELLEQDMQGSLCYAGLVGLSETLQQPQGGALCELGQEGSGGCTPGAEAEPQHGIVQPALELPEEPATFVPVPVKQEALPTSTPSLPEVLGSSGEIEAENVEA